VNHLIDWRCGVLEKGVTVTEGFQRYYYRQGYRIVGTHGHSAVKVCEWTRESLRAGRVCYKQLWYGVESHRCLQCTTSLFWCQNRCLYCWRSFQAFLGSDFKGYPVDEPSEIVDALIEGQRLLLTGFKGNPRVDRVKWKEAQNPTNAALSLTGESILYPRVSELLEEFHKRGMSTFLVTKGTAPERLKALSVEPTNLYISLCAPDAETYENIDRPIVAGGWERLNESLELMHGFSCVKVVRLTLVKDLNMKHPEKYAELIGKTGCDHVEAKAFMWVGEAQRRLPREAMPSIEDIRFFSERLSKLLGYEVKGESVPSRVVLLSKS